MFFLESSQLAVIIIGKQPHHLQRFSYDFLLNNQGGKSSLNHNIAESEAFEIGVRKREAYNLVLVHPLVLSVMRKRVYLFEQEMKLLAENGKLNIRVYTDGNMRLTKAR